MPLNLSPRLPSSLQTLRALRDLKHLIFRDNPCIKKTGICVYLSRNARVVFRKSSLSTKRRIEENYFFEVVAVDSFLAKAKWASVHQNCRIFPSDGYVCHGSISNGSGRSVFVKNHQIKGAGRTVHACFHHFHHGFNGAMSLREAFREVYFEKV